LPPDYTPAHVIQIFQCSHHEQIINVWDDR
jgi:hypothetical protein